MSLTDDDIKTLKTLFKSTLEEKTEDLLVTKEDLKQLPNRDEFYKQTLEVLDKLDKLLEKIHPQGFHSAVV